jgi:hypothetical protein
MNEKSQIESVGAIKFLKKGMCYGLTFEITVYLKSLSVNVLGFLNVRG